MGGTTPTRTALTGSASKVAAAAVGAGRRGLTGAQVQEITRLEVLCESRTKELKYAKMQLRQSAAGFQAMSVLVNYLTHDVSYAQLRSPTLRTVTLTYLTHNLTQYTQWLLISFLDLMA